MKMLLAVLAVLLAAVAVSSCSDVDMAYYSAFGEPATVDLYSGGKVVASFETTGRVSCTDGGICDFMDAATGKLVRTTGDIVVRTK